LVLFDHLPIARQVVIFALILSKSQVINFLLWLSLFVLPRLGEQLSNAMVIANIIEKNLIFY
jgi:hypothetical protein